MASNKAASPNRGTQRNARLPLVAAPRLVPAAGYRGSLRSVLVGPSVSPRLMRSPAILVFDSGVGGLTVFREIARARPDARLIYVADDALFPYGKVPEDALVARVTALMGELIAAHSPDLVVIACNTASVQALPALRERFSVPFVGTVPAIKPACAASQSKHVSVLGTEATVAREYTHALIRNFGQGCDLTLVGSARLAALAEAALSGRPVSDDDIRAEIAPCFVQDGASAPTPSCSPARTIRCCSTASSGWRPGRCAGSIRRPRSPAAWSIWSARRPKDLPPGRPARYSHRAASPPPNLLRRLTVSVLIRPSPHPPPRFDTSGVCS